MAVVVAAAAAARRQGKGSLMREVDSGLPSGLDREGPRLPRPRDRAVVCVGGAVVGQPSGALRGPHVQRWRVGPWGWGRAALEPFQEALSDPRSWAELGEGRSEAGVRALAVEARLCASWSHPRHSGR